MQNTDCVFYKLPPSQTNWNSYWKKFQLKLARSHFGVLIWKVTRARSSRVQTYDIARSAEESICLSFESTSLIIYQQNRTHKVVLEVKKKFHPFFFYFIATVWVSGTKWSQIKTQLMNVQTIEREKKKGVIQARENIISKSKRGGNKKARCIFRSIEYEKSATQKTRSHARIKLCSEAG